MSEDDAKPFRLAADLDGPWVDAKAKGHTLEYLGTEDVDGTLAHKLRVQLKWGGDLTVWIDPDTWMVIRDLQKAMVRGAEQEVETDYGDYEKVGGVYLPMSEESGPRNSPPVLAGQVGLRQGRGERRRRAGHVRVPGEDRGAGGGGPMRAAALLLASSLGAASVRVRRAACRRLRDDLRPRRPQHRLGPDERPDRGRRGPRRGRRKGDAVRGRGVRSGVWKSVDGGTTFKPVFDRQPVQSIGAIALDPSDPKVVWVGTGESWTRNSVSVGNGIYRSGDGGETWTHMGLPESERVNRILVSPKKSDVVYACVPGKLWSDSAGPRPLQDDGRREELGARPQGRQPLDGLLRPRDGPAQPGPALRRPLGLPAEGLDVPLRQRRADGDVRARASSSRRTAARRGRSSTRSRRPGLPEGPWGRLDVAIAPSKPDRVYAVIEGVKSALFRSDDGGKTWARKDDSQRMVWRPFYFSRLVVDPTNPDRVYKPNLTLIASEDGGESFTNAGGGTHGDHHDVWINPKNPKHVVTGDDGGLWISHDGANRWWKCNNLPVSQFYHVSVDEKEPYQVYGGLQDNSSWAGDSAYPGGITNSRWENLYNGDGFWVFVDPADPNFVYAEMQGGFIGRIDRRTLASRDIQPKARYKEKLRWNWNTPIHVSRLEKGKLYIGAQFLFVTKDAGQSWQRISPDLTTNDPEKQKQEKSGGITVDNSAAEMHTTIYAISESPRDAKTIWVGTDDGNLQLTRDGGATLDEPREERPGPPARELGLVGRGRSARRRRRVRRVRPPHVRRHVAVGLRDEGLREDVGADRRPVVRRARLGVRDQGGSRAGRASSISGRSSASGSRWTPGRRGPSSRAATSRPSPCATSRSRRGTRTSSSRRTGAGSGSSTT